MTDLENFVVRADYYDNGAVAPIAITFNNHSHFINYITRNKRGVASDGSLLTYIECISGNLKFNLVFNNSTWHCQYEEVDNSV